MDDADTQTIVKINALAKELRVHNLSMTRDDAAFQAERMITGRSGYFVRAGGASVEEMAPIRHDLEQEVTILKNRFNNIVGEAANIKEIQSELQSLKTQLKMLSDELAFVRNSIRGNASISAAVPSQSSVQSPGYSNQSSQSQPAAEEQPKRQEKLIAFEKAKSMNFSEKDVAVDKIFYFGKK